MGGAVAAPIEIPFDDLAARPRKALGVNVGMRRKPGRWWLGESRRMDRSQSGIASFRRPALLPKRAQFASTERMVFPALSRSPKRWAPTLCSHLP